MADISIDDEQVDQQGNNPSETVQHLETNNFAMMPPPVHVVLPVTIENPVENLTVGRLNQSNIMGTNLVRPIPVVPAPQAVTMSDLNLNLNLTMDPSPLSLRLSLPSGQRESSSSSSRHSAFQAMPTLRNGDNNNMIRVAWEGKFELEGRWVIKGDDDDDKIIRWVLLILCFCTEYDKWLWFPVIVVLVLWWNYLQFLKLIFSLH